MAVLANCNLRAELEDVRLALSFSQGKDGGANLELQAANVPWKPFSREIFPE